MADSQPVKQVELPRGLRPGEPPPPPEVQVPQCDVCVGCREWGGNGLWHHAGCTRIPAEYPGAWLEHPPAVEQAEPVAGDHPAFAACMKIANDLRNHDVVRLTAAKCALAVHEALRAAPPAPARQEPLTESQVDDLIHSKHFDRSYKLHASDETCSRWYRLGLRDGERAHGIVAAPAGGAA